jgi:cytochrome c-type biogenesis protein CcmH/NrfG
MLSMNRALSRPPMLTRLWVGILLPPTAWAAMLGMQFSLTNERCVSGLRLPMHLIAIIAVVVAILPAVLAWPRWRAIEATSAPAERTRFMSGVAVGSSAIFTLVTLLSAVPVWVLDPCRT